MSQKIIDFLKEEYTKRKSKNSRYSIRAFAEQLGIHSGTYSAIMKGKRGLTFEQAAKMLKNLGVEEAVKNALLLTFDDQNYSATILPRDLILSEEEHELTLRWEWGAIFAALGITKIKHTADSIASFIGMNRIECQNIVQTMIKLGAVEVSENGIIIEKKGAVFYPDLKWRLQKQWIKKSLEYIEEGPVLDESLLFGLTFSGSASKLPEFKRRLHDFVSSNVNWMDGDDQFNDKIFRMNIQFYPVGKNKLD